MKLNRKYERGQALILIALAIVGMIGLVALAIDGGNVFSNRRSAQNAADAAALAGALARVKNPDLPPADLSALAKAAALARATSNNFTTDASNTVTVNNPPGAGCSGTSGPYAGNAEYIQVIIRTTVSTFFAPVVGITQLHNCVEAIARAKPGEDKALCHGALICALDDGITEKTDDGKNALSASGTSEVTLIGAGAFSNSNHSTAALYVQKNKNLQIQPPYGVMAVGVFNIIPSPYFYIPTGDIIPQIHKAQLPYPLPSYMLPPPYTCDYDISNGYVDLPHNNVTDLDPGVYCLTGNFNEDSYTIKPGGIGGVTIVMLNKGFIWSGNKPTRLYAPTSGPTKGLLIYLPYGNSSTVKFAGTGDLNIVGTILAPEIGSKVIYIGAYDTGVFRSQLVGWKFEFGGGALGDVTMPPEVYHFKEAPLVELVK
jgi:type II secretory pathway pseudopilin PulG